MLQINGRKLPKNMSKQFVNRPGVSSPLYSEAIIHDGVVYCSGKIGLDPETKELVGHDIADRTVRRWLPYWFMVIMNLLATESRYQITWDGSRICWQRPRKYPKGCYIRFLISRKELIVSVSDIHHGYERLCCNERCMLVGFSHWNEGSSLWPDTAAMPDPKPARICVEVTKLGKGAKVSYPTKYEMCWC